MSMRVAPHWILDPRASDVGPGSSGRGFVIRDGSRAFTRAGGFAARWETNRQSRTLILAMIHHDDEGRWLGAVREIVLRELAASSATVYLFGSRARGTARRGSDVDVAVDGASDLSIHTLSRLREVLEESTIPFRVDVVDLRDATPAFRERVLAEGIRWRP